MGNHYFEDMNMAVITTRQILELGADIVLVLHDEDDGSWQFLSEKFQESDARIVSLKNILTLDTTLNNLKDLEVGWSARRANKSEEWKRESRSRTSQMRS